jgi:hypothetical protein
MNILNNQNVFSKYISNMTKFLEFEDFKSKYFQIYFILNNFENIDISIIQANQNILKSKLL